MFAKLITGVGIHRVEIAVRVHAAHIVHRGGYRCLDAGVDSRRIDRHAAPAANANDSNTFRIHVIAGGKVIDGGAEILRIDIRRRDIAGKSSAFSRIRGIKRDRQKTSFGHRLGIKARRLFLYSPERAGNGNSRQFPVNIPGHIQIRSQHNAITVAETYLAVGYLVAFRKHFVPFLR